MTIHIISYLNFVFLQLIYIMSQIIDTAPWCFMPSGDDGFIIFTCRVPWLHHGICGGTKEFTRRGYYGQVEKEEVFKQRYFIEARTIMSKNSWVDKRDVPMIDNPEDMQHHLHLNEDEIFTFTQDGCYPDKSDISQGLEDTAVAITCEVLNWPFPIDWRKHREAMSSRRCKYEIFDLAAHDERKKLLREHFSINKRMKYTTLPASVTESLQGEKEDGKQNGEDTNEENDPMSVEKQIGSDNQDGLSHLIGYLEGAGGTPEHGSDNHHHQREHQEVPLPPLVGPLVSHDSAEEEKKDDQYYQHVANNNDDHLHAFYGEEEVVEGENDTGDVFFGWD